MSGSTIGGVVGGAVGFVVGGPAGAQWGWMIGSAVGGYVDPTQIEGPRLKDARAQTSRDGIPIPFGWGTFPVSGNIIWQQPGVTEVKRTERQGKGGPEVTTYTYTRSYAIGICEGPITGLLQIKRNGKLVYDARDDATLEAEYTAFGMTAAEALQKITGQRAENAKFIDSCVVYLGDETQDPDPTIEAYLGVDNVPSYRGLAYIVVTDDDVTDLQGAIPQLEFVVAACGSTTAVTAPHPFTYMLQSSQDGRLYTSIDGDTWTQSFTGSGHVSYVTTIGNRILTSNQISDSIGAYVSDDFGQTFTAVSSWPTLDTAEPVVLSTGRIVVLQVHNTSAVVYYSDDDMATWTSVALGMGAFLLAGDDDCLIVASTTHRKVSTNGGASFGSSLANGFDCTSIGHKAGMFVFGGAGAVAFRWSGDNGTTMNTCTGSFPAASQSISLRALSDGSWISASAGLTVRTTDNIYRSPNGKTGWVGVTTPSMYFGEGTESGRLAELNGTVIAVGRESGNFLQIIKSTDWGQTWSAVTHGYSGFTVYPGVGVAVFGDHSQAIPDAPGYYTDPAGVVTGTGGEYVTPCAGVALSTILGDLCDRSGLSSDEYDWSDQTQEVPGFVVARETDAASVISVLAPAYFFDTGEWDGKLRGVNRGGTSVFAINGDDLVERDGDPWERERVQEAELLRRVTVGYIDPAANYGPTTQKWERRAGTVQARGEASFELPITMPSDDAATIAKRRGLTAWGEPEKQKASLPYRLSAITPTDVGTYTDDDGEIHNVRAMQREDDSGVLYFEFATNCAEAYNATATGVAAKPPTITDVKVLGPTILKAMNLDSLQAQDNVPGMYFGAVGVLPGWPGCTVEMSKDGGSTFEPIATLSAPATMGFISRYMVASTEPVRVQLYSGGQLSSATPAQITAGVNAAAIVSGSTAEIIQFETATALGSSVYECTDVTFGVNDTTPAPHAYNDAFVLLDSAVLFVPIDSSLSGETLVFRGVTLGTSSDAATTIAVTYEPPTFVIDGGEVT